jgi:hypothetical protein
MIAIALDPGVTTGYAIGDIDNNGKMNVVSGQERWGHEDLWVFLIQNKPEVIVSERFEFRNKARTGLELYSRELIGVTKLYAQIHMWPPHAVIEQMPGTVLGGFFSDDQLKRDHLYKEARPHANDAMRHLLHWYQFGSGYQYNKEGYEGIA